MEVLNLVHNLEANYFFKNSSSGIKVLLVSVTVLLPSYSVHCTQPWYSYRVTSSLSLTLLQVSLPFQILIPSSNSREQRPIKNIAMVAWLNAFMCVNICNSEAMLDKMSISSQYFRWIVDRRTCKNLTKEIKTYLLLIDKYDDRRFHVTIQ